MPLPLGERSELIFAVMSGIFLCFGFALSFVDGVSPETCRIAYIISMILGGFYTSIEAYQSIRHGAFEIDYLMLAAAAGAAALGEWAEGALLLFLFSIGHALEHYAMGKAEKSIEALSGLAVKTALVKHNGKVIETSIDDLQLGEVVVVKPNTKIPVDGIVIEGKSAVNQAPITGESLPVHKSPIVHLPDATISLDKIATAHRSFAGSINGSGVLEIQVRRTAEDSTIARLIRLVEDAQQQKSPTQLLTDKVQKYYVPAVLILVALLLLSPLLTGELFRDSFYRAMAVLVAASPCALAISTPSAVLSGIARAARGGVLLKGGRPLEALGSLDSIAFDKTGTLTLGEPHITSVFAMPNSSEQELLRVAVAVENLSDHPLAEAITTDGLARLGVDEAENATNLQAISGMGIEAIFEGKVVHIGNKALFEHIFPKEAIPEQLDEQAEHFLAEGQTIMMVRHGKQYLGLIGLQDTPRPEVIATLAALKKSGIKKMVMISGDHQKVATAIAQEIGLTDALGNLLPEDKVAAINQMKQQGHKVAMVGDGVNDAPAMASATVGIAMGAAGSDVALETADVALMADNLSTLPFAIGLSKLAHRIIRQNLVFSLGMVAILVPLTLFGVANMAWAVVMHEGSTLLVVFNALRLLAYKR